MVLRGPCLTWQYVAQLRLDKDDEGSIDGRSRAERSEIAGGLVGRCVLHASSQQDEGYDERREDDLDGGGLAQGGDEENCVGVVDKDGAFR